MTVEDRLFAQAYATGVFLLTLFGIFEKKRNEVLIVIDDLRQWEA